MKHACTDCVEVHGDDAAEWLRKWPAGAERREELHAWLCDGCADERYDDLARRDPLERSEDDATMREMAYGTENDYY